MVEYRIGDAKFHRLGRFWFERYPNAIRLGLGDRTHLHLQNLRSKPWAPLFSTRNGYARGVIVLAGGWLVWVR
jgi:hypothetical protein